MHRKISNPYADDKGYNCFACSPNNPIGLNMEFFDCGEFIESLWSPSKDFEGFHNILHGGIQSTMLDEIAAWCVNIQAKTAGVTVRMNISYHKAVLMDKGKLRLRAKIIERKRNVVSIEAKLYNAEDVLCTEGIIDYYTFPEEIAKERYHYPGVDAFYGD